MKAPRCPTVGTSIWALEPMHRAGHLRERILRGVRVAMAVDRFPSAADALHATALDLDDHHAPVHQGFADPRTHPVKVVIVDDDLGRSVRRCHQSGPPEPRPTRVRFAGDPA